MSEPGTLCRIRSARLRQGCSSSFVKYFVVGGERDRPDTVFGAGCRHLLTSPVGGDVQAVAGACSHDGANGIESSSAQHIRGGAGQGQREVCGTDQNPVGARASRRCRRLRPGRTCPRSSGRPVEGVPRPAVALPESVPTSGAPRARSGRRPPPHVPGRPSRSAARQRHRPPCRVPSSLVRSSSPASVPRPRRRRPARQRAGALPSLFLSRRAAN